MPRKKVKLAYITNYSKRRAAFKQRRDGLIQKIDELCILCGIEACAIAYIPEDPQPTVWPSNVGVQRVISRFGGMSELEQNRNKLTRESFLKMSIIKGQDKLRKMRDEHRKIEISLHMSQYFFNGWNIFDNANIIDLNDMAHLTNQKLGEIERKINVRQAQEVTPILENVGEIMTQGEQAIVNNVQVPDADTRQNLNGDANGDGWSEMLTLEDVNVDSGWLNSFNGWEKF